MSVPGQVLAANISRYFATNEALLRRCRLCFFQDVLCFGHLIVSLCLLELLDQRREGIAVLQLTLREEFLIDRDLIIWVAFLCFLCLCDDLSKIIVTK